MPADEHAEALGVATEARIADVSSSANALASADGGGS